MQWYSVDMKKNLFYLTSISILIPLVVVLYLLSPQLKKREVLKTAVSLQATESLRGEDLTQKQQQAHNMFKFGQHFILGYSDSEELKKLIDLGAIGGVFITQKNIAGKSKTEIRAEIASFQEVQAGNKLPPLFIATDQEGGPVARMTPPLIDLPTLSSLLDQADCSEVVDSCFTKEEQEAVRSYAHTQASELKELGINLNFAPVVDVYGETEVKNDKYTHLNLRALGRYAWLIKAISNTYVTTLSSEGILTTRKHFPGLGSATKDTHISSAHVTKSKEELEQNDWIPFQEEGVATLSGMMLSHAVLDAVDKETPTSFSEKVVGGLLRNEWGYNGILITDDFSMYPVRYSWGGVGGASIKALNAGVDLILISFKPELYYSAMSAVLDAQEKGELNHEALEKSNKRLDKARHNID